MTRLVFKDPERSRLATYVERFNARDFDAIRDLLADEVRLDLVNRTRMEGRRDVDKYFHNYGLTHDWHLVTALVDGRPALAVRDPSDPLARITYFILLQWTQDRLVQIRDFRYARYVAGQLDSLDEDLSILKAKTAEKQEPFAAVLSCAWLRSKRNPATASTTRSSGASEKSV